MNTAFDSLNPKESAFVVVFVCGASILYALVFGRVFLMPYTANRKENPRAFYVLLVLICIVFGMSVRKLLKS